MSNTTPNLSDEHAAAARARDQAIEVVATMCNMLASDDMIVTERAERNLRSLKGAIDRILLNLRSSDWDPTSWNLAVTAGDCMEDIGRLHAIRRARNVAESRAAELGPWIGTR